MRLKRNSILISRVREEVGWKEEHLTYEIETTRLSVRIYHQSVRWKEEHLTYEIETKEIINSTTHSILRWKEEHLTYEIETIKGSPPPVTFNSLERRASHL